MRINRTKFISNKLLFFAFVGASALFLAGLFYISKANQLLNYSGMSVFSFLSGEVYEDQIKDIPSFVLALRVLVFGVTKVSLSMLLYALIWMRFSFQRGKRPCGDERR